MVEAKIVDEISTEEAWARIKFPLNDFKNYIKTNRFKRKDLADQIGVSKKYVDDLLDIKAGGPNAVINYQKLMNITGFKGENIYIHK
ncbi:hypothetical protein [Weissella bombi]|uniref:HTH cro/C1-type domain-containing protein n=1 Tax=Weissella bombi TaxID=1505725 RepID=A0A1C4C1U3_9LACO|nr:hypothetical protein [Weissella bombi]SCC12933.1 hypothetical protein GA0061074_11923 [Weissella bombi]